MHALQQGGHNELSPYIWRKETRAIFLGSAYPAVQWQVFVGSENDEAQALYNFGQFAFHASEFLVPALKCKVFLVEWVALVTVKWRKHRCPLQRIGNGYDRDVQGIEQPGLQPDARRDTSKRSIVVTADGRAVSSQVKQWKHFSRMRNGDGVPVSVSFFDPSSLLACHLLPFLCMTGTRATRRVAISIFLIDSLSYWSEGALLRDTEGIGTDRGGSWGSLPDTFLKDTLPLMPKAPDAHQEHQIGINRSREARQEAGRSVGARVDDAGWCGPLWSPAGWGVIVSSNTEANGRG